MAFLYFPFLFSSCFLFCKCHFNEDGCLHIKVKLMKEDGFGKKKEEKIAMVVLPFLLYNSFIIKFSVYLSGTRIFKVEWKEVEFLRGLGTFSGTSCTLLRSFWRIYDSCKKEVEYYISKRGSSPPLFEKKVSFLNISIKSISRLCEDRKSQIIWLLILYSKRRFIHIQ